MIEYFGEETINSTKATMEEYFKMKITKLR